MGIEKTNEVFIKGVSGKSGRGSPAGIGITIRVDCGSKSFYQSFDFLLRRGVTCGVSEPGKPGNVLSKAMTRSKSVGGVVPTAHVLPGRRQSRAETVNLEQAILIERQICGVDSVKLALKRTARKLHVGVAKKGELLANWRSGLGLSA
jgi:hypothetical protein